MFELEILIVACCIFVSGILVGRFFTLKNTQGEMLVDTSDPEKDQYLLNIHVPLDEFGTRKWIVLKVSQKIQGV